MTRGDYLRDKQILFDRSQMQSLFYAHCLLSFLFCFSKQKKMYSKMYSKIGNA